MRFRRHFFSHTEFLRFKISKKKFKIQILGIIEKCIGCFLVYLFLGVFFLLNVLKRMCIFDSFKIALLLVKNVFFGLKKSIREFLHWVAQKHTAVSLLTLGRLILRWLLHGWLWLLLRSDLFC